jgi:hypothetical protein
MNVTFNSDTVAFLIHEIDDMLCNADISAGTCDDLSNLLNALMDIDRAGSIVIVKDDDNIDDDWDDDSDGYSPDDDGPDDGPDDGGQPVPIGWDVAG